MSSDDERTEPPHVADAPEPTTAEPKKKRKRRKRRESSDEQHEPEAAPKRNRMSVGFKSPTTLRKLHAAARTLGIDNSALVAHATEEWLEAREKQRRPATWSDNPSNKAPQPTPPKRRRGFLGASGPALMLASVDDRIYAVLDRESREDERDDE